MQLLEVKRVMSQGDSNGYYLKGCQDDTYFPGQCADIVAHGVSVGRLGVLHPETLAKFDLELPVAAFEINLQHFL